MEWRAFTQEIVSHPSVLHPPFRVGRPMGMRDRDKSKCHRVPFLNSWYEYEILGLSKKLKKKRKKEKELFIVIPFQE